MPLLLALGHVTWDKLDGKDVLAIEGKMLTVDYGSVDAVKIADAIPAEIEVPP